MTIMRKVKTANPNPVTQYGHEYSNQYGVPIYRPRSYIWGANMGCPIL